LLASRPRLQPLGPAFLKANRETAPEQIKSRTQTGK
jgi:hypothetical protein